MANYSQLNAKRAVRNRVYTNKTHLRGFKDLDFLLVRAGGLRLCSREFYSPRLKLTRMAMTLYPYRMVYLPENSCNETILRTSDRMVRII